MNSTESTNDVWLSGDETIHFVNELFSGPIDPRATGRTIRLALRYVELSLKVAPARIKVEDHHPGLGANQGLVNVIRKIFDAINIDFKIAKINEVEKDDSTFTGTTQTGKVFYYLTAQPVGLKTGDYTVPTT